MQPKPLRCAIYTRKSTDDGLDKEFNSLDAQREACEAYIRSQKHEAWMRIDTPYDDGGYSGGTMERPGLKALLADVTARKIDIIVVYKVDRLSRSLSDFAQMVQILDAHQVSFVSITQQFNTTNSMGRLTLNMLLSFAQFEREVIGERVRDKVAASKQKGMWMGGVPPLGYDVVGRKLVINSTEAQLVQKIFTDYAALQSLNQLAQKLNAEGYRNKRWVTANGIVRGGQPFTNQSLSKILNNPAYLGHTRHHKKLYDGQHEAIISQKPWDKTQALLKQNLVRKKPAASASGNAASKLLLSGNVIDENGQLFTTTYTIKHKTKRYHYYLQKITNRRVRAATLDHLAVAMLHGLAYVPEIWHASALFSGDKQSWRSLWQQWEALPSATQQTVIQRLVDSVVFASEQLTLHLRASSIRTILDDEALAPWLRCALTPDSQKPAPMPTTTLRGDHIALTAPTNFASTQSNTTAPNPALLKALVRSHRWNQLLDARKITITAIAKETKLGRPYVSRIINLKFLAPDIVEAILSGTQPQELQLRQLMGQLPMEWGEQKRWLNR